MHANNNDICNFYYGFTDMWTQDPRVTGNIKSGEGGLGGSEQDM